MGLLQLLQLQFMWPFKVLKIADGLLLPLQILKCLGHRAGNHSSCQSSFNLCLLQY